VRFKLTETGTIVENVNETETKKVTTETGSSGNWKSSWFCIAHEMSKASIEQADNSKSQKYTGWLKK